MITEYRQVMKFPFQKYFLVLDKNTKWIVESFNAEITGFTTTLKH